MDRSFGWIGFDGRAVLIYPGWAYRRDRLFLQKIPFGYGQVGFSAELRFGLVLIFDNWLMVCSQKGVICC